MLELMQTFLSPTPKELWLKLEVLGYDTVAKRFVPLDSAIINHDILPNHLGWDGQLSVDIMQSVKQQLSLTLANIPTPFGIGIHNWSAFFNPANEFRWWLDKRLNISIGLKLDTPAVVGETIQTIGWIPLGQFAIVNFETNHTLTDFPACRLTCSSLEVLFTDKRGKFLNPTTLTRHTVAQEAIRTIVKDFISADTIRIDSSVGLLGTYLEKGDDIAMWTAGANSTITTSTDFMYGVTGKDTSILIHTTTSMPQILATKIFPTPQSVYEMDAIGLWIRTSHNFFGGELGIRFVDTDGNIAESGFLSTVGHIIDGNEIIETKLDNWRNMLLSLDGQFADMSNIKRIEIVLFTPVPKYKEGFSIWIDNIYTAQNKATLPYELTYGAGSNRWQAIEEICELIDCDAFFDRQGNFIVRKRRIPKPKDGSYYNYDRYEVPVPKITFSDKPSIYNLYAGATSTFVEYDLANHTQALGGATYQPISCVAEFALRTDGLHMKEKGMRINQQGRPRPVDREIVYNADTDIKELYDNDKKLDQILLDYPKPPAFAACAQPPVSNFAIERIGDMIYHHNNASFDPVIFYTYEAKNRALWELKKRLAYAEQLVVPIAPYYLLEGYDIVRIEDTLLNINDNFELRGMDIPLNGEMMTLHLNKIRNAILDIPFFDESHTKRCMSFYNRAYYSCCGLFPALDRRYI